MNHCTPSVWSFQIIAHFFSILHILYTLSSGDKMFNWRGRMYKSIMFVFDGSDCIVLYIVNGSPQSQ